MKKYICITCGVQYSESDSLPARCAICEDERQWVNHAGQKWTNMNELCSHSHNFIETLEPYLTSIRTVPVFGIGQQACLVQTDHGNILWDCISLIDGETIRAINALGGVSAIAISHPHFYGAMAAWSHAFDNAPIYLHAADRAYVMDPTPSIIFWEGESHVLGDGLTLVRCGGHFEGASLLHWAAGSGGRGVLLSSDTIMVVMDSRYVSFMYSYPNYIPLSEKEIRRILQATEPFPFERIYCGWPDRICKTNAKESVAVSAKRYISHIRGQA